MLKLCDWLENGSGLVQEGNVNCWIKRMDEFVRRETSNAASLPLSDEVEFNRYLHRFIDEDPAGIEAYRTQRLGFVVDELADADAEFQVKLQFITITALSIGSTQYTREFKMPIYEAWQAVLADFSANAPAGLGTVYQTASVHWPWMETERAFFMNAVKGMLISLVFACAAVFAATKNWIVTLYAVHAVAFICAAEIALQHLNGYEMGVAESVGSIMVMGYSVDYVVHLAAHYVHSPAPTRKARTTESLGEMGISIFGGALTTLGSSGVLFLCELFLFRKFAFMITTTVGLAFVFSLFYFIALSHSLGPEGKSGDIDKATKKCLKQLKDTKGDGEKRSSSSGSRKRKRTELEKARRKIEQKEARAKRKANKKPTQVELVSIHSSDSVELD